MGNGNGFKSVDSVYTSRNAPFKSSRRHKSDLAKDPGEGNKITSTGGPIEGLGEVAEGGLLNKDLHQGAKDLSRILKQVAPSQVAAMENLATNPVRDEAGRIAFMQELDRIFTDIEQSGFPMANIKKLIDRAMPGSPASATIEFWQNEKAGSKVAADKEGPDGEKVTAVKDNFNTQVVADNSAKPEQPAFDNSGVGFDSKGTTFTV